MLELTQPEADAVRPLLDSVPFNELFARVVVEGTARGQVLADSLDSPRAAWITHSYGMSLLVGDPAALSDEAFCSLVARPRARDEWLQVHPEAWADRIDALIALGPRDGGRVRRHTRVNFQFRAARYASIRHEVDCSRCEVARVDEGIFHAMRGSVVPAGFWDSAKAFVERGLGFAVMSEGCPAAVAFSSFVRGNLLELGIETAPAFRGRGLARTACVALIDACLARGLTPVWSCRLGNAPSFRLAESLGFEPTLRLPYYQLLTNE
ncbi:MAG: GNAT family N-acetyltransferase [Polyangiaceae bacterium]